MTAISLPDQANLDQLRKQARDLQRAVRAAAPEALAEVAQRHPAGWPDDAVAASFPLSAAHVPSDQPWQTALHRAAESGDLDLARTLLRLGADPDIRDQRFDGTPARLGPPFRPGTAD